MIGAGPGLLDQMLRVVGDHRRSADCGIDRRSPMADLTGLVIRTTVSMVDSRIPVGRGRLVDAERDEVGVPDVEPVRAVVEDLVVMRTAEVQVALAVPVQCQGRPRRIGQRERNRQPQ